MSLIKGKIRRSGGGRSVTQQHPMGCAVACVAYCLGRSYPQALSLFQDEKEAWGRGFYCPEIVKILKTEGRNYRWYKFSAKMRLDSLPPLSIVFFKATEAYRQGHFVVKVGDRVFMNPWINAPVMTPAKSGFQSQLPGGVAYVIECMDSGLKEQ